MCGLHSDCCTGSPLVEGAHSTRTCSWPASLSRTKAFLVAVAVCTLPKMVVSPITSTSGELKAAKMARESSARCSGELEVGDSKAAEAVWRTNTRVCVYDELDGALGSSCHIPVPPACRSRAVVMS